MKPVAWIGAAALAGVILAAGLRRGAAEAPRPAVKARHTAPISEVAVPTAPEPIRGTAERLRIPPSDVEAFVAASREVVRDLRRLQQERQAEWSADLDRQTRLEREERYDADRKAAVGRLDRFLDEGEGHRKFRDEIDTWAATVWAREQGMYP